MLERGFHRSFAEIFELIKQQADHRVAAGPDSELWSQRLLTQEPDKLDVMRDQLVEAESAMLLGNFYQSVCVSSLCLSLCIWAAYPQKISNWIWMKLGNWHDVPG